jgi:hypothetical protein
MHLKCCCTQVLDCKGVYCSAYNAAVPLGIRDLESVGPGQTRIRPRNRCAAASAPPPMTAAVMGAAALSCSGFLGGGCFLKFLWRRRRRRRLSWAILAAAAAAFLAAVAAFFAPGGLASVVILVGGAGPVIVLVILAAGAGVAGVAGVALTGVAGALSRPHRPQCRRPRLRRRRVRRLRRRRVASCCQGRAGALISEFGIWQYWIYCSIIQTITRLFLHKHSLVEDSGQNPHTAIKIDATNFKSVLGRTLSWPWLLVAESLNSLSFISS